MVENCELTIPVFDEEVNEEWLKKVLSKDDIQEIKVEKALEKGENFMSNPLYVHIEYSDLSDISLMIKLMPTAEAHHKLVKDMRLFQKEVEFYNNIYPQLQKISQHNIGIPKCHFAAVTSDAAIIVLEDLRKRGYQMKDKLLGLDFSHVQIAFKELAKFHAAGYALKQSSEEPLPQRFPNIGQDHFNKQLGAILQKSSQDCVELMRKYGLDEHQLNRMQNYVSNTDFYERRAELVRAKEPFATICHGDCWNNNFMFRPSATKEGEPQSVMLVDFQLCRYSNPLLDLCYFLYTSTTRELRKNHLTYLLFCYHDTLFTHLKSLGVEFCKEDYPFDEFMKDFHHYSEYGFSVSILLLPRVLETDRIIDVTDEKDWSRVNNCSKDILRRIAGVVEDMVETGVI